MTPVGEQLVRALVRAMALGRSVEARTLAPMAAAILVAEGLTPEAVVDRRSQGESAGARRQRLWREKHGPARTGSGRLDAVTRDASRDGPECDVTPAETALRDASRDAVSEGGFGGKTSLSRDFHEKSESGLLDGGGTGEETERYATAGVTPPVTALRNGGGGERASEVRRVAEASAALGFRSDAPEKKAREFGALYPVPEGAVLLPGWRAYAELAGVRAIDAVFLKFTLLAVERQWKFDSAGWTARWKRFCSEELPRQRVERERARGGLAKGGERVAEPADSRPGWDPIEPLDQLVERERREHEAEERIAAAAAGDQGDKRDG